MEDRGRSRTNVFVVLVVILFGLLSLQLFNLQVIDTKYHAAAEENVVKKRRTEPVRGEIYDRNGEKIAYNIVVYDLEILYVAAEKDLNVRELAKVLEMPIEEVKLKHENFIEGIENGTISKVRKYPLVRALDTTTSFRMRERLLDFPGLSLRASSRREYALHAPAHLLGYMGEINREELSIYTGKGYRMGDYIGQGGIEAEFESSLRGENGEAFIIEDVYGAERGKFEEGINDVKALPGSDIFLTIDLKLQQYARELMDHKKGAVVALNPQTGEILAIVSTPDYSLSEIMGKNRGSYFKKLSNAPGDPFLDRSLMGEYQPGSTFKTISALIALSNNTWQRSKSYTCQYYYQLSDKTVLKCSHSHAPAKNIGEALMHSCNPYFWEVFKKCVYGLRKESYAQALDDWGDACRSFGLGNTLLNLNLAESSGNVPWSNYYDGLYGEKRWAPTAMISLGIGQGELSLTPLQMAFSYSIIANRGNGVFYPSLIRRVGDLDQNRTAYENIYDVSHSDYTAVIEGLRRAVQNGGTAEGSAIPGIEFGGKTGTVEKRDQPSHSLFVGMAPLSSPKIVIAVVVENGGAGGETAAPIASLMAEKYLTGEISDSRKALANAIQQKNTINWDEE